MSGFLLARLLPLSTRPIFPFRSVHFLQKYSGKSGIIWNCTEIMYKNLVELTFFYALDYSTWKTQYCCKWLYGYLLEDKEVFLIKTKICSISEESEINSDIFLHKYCFIPQLWYYPNNVMVSAFYSAKKKLHLWGSGSRYL